MAGKKKFEDVMKELEDIVEKLESEELSLDESIDLFHKGVKLSKVLTERLDQVEFAINELIEDNKDQLKEKKFELGEL